MAIDQKKIILKNKPYANANAQYNYGDVGIGWAAILGMEQGDIFINDETQLYTIVDDSIEPAIKEGGIMWLSAGSKLEITSLTITSNRIDTDDSGSPNYYRHTKVAIYLFDDAITPAIKNISSGNQVRDLIGEGDNFGSSPHCIAYWDKGHSQENVDLGEVVAASPWTSDDLTVRDFPRELYGKYSTFSGEIVDKDIINWTNAVSGYTDSNYYIVVRTAGDENEYAILGHGWLGLSGGYKVDERDRGYAIMKVPKKDLYSKWKLFNKDEITFAFGITGADFDYTFNNSSDNYGDNRGHKYLNNRPRCWDIKSLTLTITTPLWSPTKAIEDNNSMWIYPLDSAGNGEVPVTYLNPKYDIDYIGCPVSFYNTSGNKFFKSSLLLDGDFRPISHVSESMANSDLQNYYIQDTLEYRYTSAPAEVSLQFSIADNYPNYNIPYKDINFDTDDIKYGFFVDNWDWQSDDPETLEEITNSFPLKTSEIQYRQTLYGEYTFHRIDASNSDSDTAKHTYSESGLKIIKAIVFSYIQNAFVDLSDGSTPFDTHIQAYRWKLVTIQVNLNQNAFTSIDFTEVGGSTFTYMPYPEILEYCSDFSKWPTACLCPDPTDDTDVSSGTTQTVCESILCGDQIAYAEWYEGLTPISDCDDNKIVRTSHPIISGLSADSSYLKSLQSVIKSNKFSEAEGGEKLLATKSYENSPRNRIDEYGTYIGEADIAQVRYLKTGTLNIHELLGIDYMTADGFKPYWKNEEGEYWDGDNNTFPLETLVTDIFIDGNLNLRDQCIIELNCGEVSNTILNDSSGNGNIGIMFGDYSIKKIKRDIPAVKNSYFKLPKTSKSNGAF